MTGQQLKRGIFLSVSISVVAIVLVMVLTQGGFSWQLFYSLDTTYLLLSLYIVIIFWMLRAGKLKVLTDSLGGRIAFTRVFAIYLASVFVAHVTPSSSGGLPFVVYFLHREGLPLGKTTALTVMDSMLTLILLLVLSPVLLVVWGGSLRLEPGMGRLFYLALVLVVLFVVGSLVLVFNTGLARGFVGWLTGRRWLKRYVSEARLRGFREFVFAEIGYFREGMGLLLADRTRLVLVLLLTLCYWGFYLSLAPVLLRGLGVKVPVIPVILAQIVFNVIQPVIPTPGGSGGAELGFAYLFKFMVPGTMLGLFVAGWRFFIFYTSLVVGGGFFIQLVRGTGFLEVE